AEAHDVGEWRDTAQDRIVGPLPGVGVAGKAGQLERVEIPKAVEVPRAGHAIAVPAAARARRDRGEVVRQPRVGDEAVEKEIGAEYVRPVGSENRSVRGPRSGKRLQVQIAVRVAGAEPDDPVGVEDVIDPGKRDDTVAAVAL